MRQASALVLVVLAVLVAMGLFWAGGLGRTTTGAVTAAQRSGPAHGVGAPTRTAASTRAAAADRSLLAKAKLVLASVDATGQAPKGYVGGRQFMNDTRGGTASLPRSDAAGRPVAYHEYDVNPYRQGVNRGPQRLAVGSDGSAVCTGDHYVTWTRLR
jgi:ribonuclease T1